MGLASSLAHSSLSPEQLGTALKCIDRVMLAAVLVCVLVSLCVAVCVCVHVFFPIFRTGENI